MAHFQQGRRLYQVSDYRAALDEFKRGFLLKDDPVFLFNIAQCHRQLGDRKEALTFYKRYLAGSPDAENRSQVEKLIADLEKTPERAPPASATPDAALSGPTGTQPRPPVGTAAVPVTFQPEPGKPIYVSGAPGNTPGPPPSTRWWIWATAGAVAIGVVTAAVLLTRDRSNPDCRGINPCGTLR
jgi:tetratricopeptide (TPR) repeat protein